MIECANAVGRPRHPLASRPPCRPSTPASQVATEYVTSTSRMNPSKPSVPDCRVDMSDSVMYLIQTGEFENPSYAVEPSITETVATSPAAGASESRLLNGLRMTSLPSYRRPSGDR